MCKRPPMKFSDFNTYHNLFVGSFKFEIDVKQGVMHVNESGSDEDDNGEFFTTVKYLDTAEFNHYSAERMAVLFTEMAKNMKEEHRLDHIAFEAKQKKQKADTAKRSKAAKAGHKKSKAKPLKKKAK